VWLFLQQMVVVGEQYLDMVGGRNNITNPLKYTVQNVMCVGHKNKDIHRLSTVEPHFPKTTNY
jgi:hypothetical protein